MRNFNKFVLILLAHFIIVGSALSETYYVNDATGSNGNSAALAKNFMTPWKTVQYAIDNAAVVAGDNIVVAEGTYSGFIVSKRVNIIGVWKGSNPLTNTIVNSTVTLTASGGNPSSRMVLKNMRIVSPIGDAVDARESFFTLENVFASSGQTYGLRFNADISDALLESCNFDNSTYCGIYFPTLFSTRKFRMYNSTASNNAYWGIAAFQRANNPTVIDDVEIIQCAFENNNPSNQQQGHQIYFEKLSNSVFRNISVVTPPGNIWIGIDINLLARTDYTDIQIFNSNVKRATPGSGIWIQARNDLINPPASLDTVFLRGLSFENCDTLIAFNRQVLNMVVEKCDLSNYLVYGLVNYSDQGGTINASDNKWKNGGTPDTTVISGGLLTSGNPIISFMPSTVGIFIGMGIQGAGIPAGTTVIGKSPNTITMSANATANAFIPSIGFAFNFATSTDLVRTSLNTINYFSTKQYSIINQDNQDFPDLASAIAGTTSGGTIWNVPSGIIPGNTVVDRNLTLISSGSGFLSPMSLTTFQNLSITNATMTMRSDFAVADNFSPNRINIGLHNTLVLNGSITPGGIIEGGMNSDLVISGAGPSTGLTTVENGIRNFRMNRASGISLLDNIWIHRLLFLSNGVVSLGNFDVNLGTHTTTFNPNPSNSYVGTNGSGNLNKYFEASTPGLYNLVIGNNGAANAKIFLSNATFAPDAYVSAKTINTIHPNNGCGTDYLNRYWTLSQNGISGYNVWNQFGYQDADVVGTEASLNGAKWNGFQWTSYTPVNAAGNNFVIPTSNSFGDYTAGSPTCLGGSNTIANLKVLLQGAYIGGGNMRTSMNGFGLIPLSQPYNTTQFSYNGTESVTSIPAGVVDWVYVELRDTDNGSAILNGKRAGFVKSDGSIVDLDGVSPLKFTSVAAGMYYVVVGHRNHLPVMSANKTTLNAVSTVYDFATDLTKYYGGDAASLTGGLFGLYAGDANRSFIVSAADYTVVTNNLLQANYNDGDLNLNGTVTSADYGFVTNSLTKASQVPNYQ
ncbi:MAG TPA: hypothetical protein PLD63_09550 [Ignavibacteria bacterium]|nr:hypothetical protein [Ignavibacteria bacterium]